MSGWIKAIHSYLARSWRLVEFNLYDFFRYARHSFALHKAKTRQQHRSQLVMEYHRIEKGLALRNPRPGFGEGVVRNTINLIDNYTKKYGLDPVAVACIDTLSAYEKFNKTAGLDIPYVHAAIERFATNYKCVPAPSTHGGAVEVTKAEVHKAALSSFDIFANARYSVRDFSNTSVEASLIEKAVLIAQRSPSVCNRQSGRVHVYSTPELKKALLSLQSGNRGFGDQIDQLIIVTTDLQCFSNPDERNQGWVDGGMFAMSLIYALHYLGLGTCCLNWSTTRQRDLEIRKFAGIPEAESLIMMIGVGHLPERFSVARSARISINEVLFYH